MPGTNAIKEMVDEQVEAVLPGYLERHGLITVSEQDLINALAHVDALSQRFGPSQQAVANRAAKWVTVYLARRVRLDHEKA